MRRLAGRAAAAGGLTGLLGLLTARAAWAGSDLFENVAPASPLGNAAAFARWPFFHYELDRHFTVISASITGGVDVSGLLPAIAWFFASVIWLVTAFLAKVVVELFAFAFSLDLVNGSDATGGQGALGPVSRAIHSIYAHVFGAPWLVLAFSAVAVWAMWKALVQRRYSETAGALALSLIYIVVALFFVVEPAQTIGRASGWTNEMSQAFLSIPANGDPTEGEQATAGDADQLWGLLVTEPWTVLQFGGLEHCALDGTGDEDHDPESAPVRPLARDAGRDDALARQLHEGDEVAAEGKTCINNEAKYASHFLRFGNGTDERDEEYEALDHGDSEEVPEADKEKAGYKLGVADKPATDAMEEGGQYQRLIMAPLVAIGELGAFLLLGSLSIGVILSQVLLLLLLAFSPVALVAAAIPGRGHDFFKAWLQKLAGYLLRKAAYSLVLAVLLAVNAAIASATSELGWLFSFGLQAAFFWAVLIQRRSLAGGITGIVTGQKAGGNELALDAAALYGGARLARGSTRGAWWATKGVGRTGRWFFRRSDALGPRLAFGSKRVSRPVDWSDRGGGEEPDTRRPGGGEDRPDGPRSGGDHDGPDRPHTGGKERRRRRGTDGDEKEEGRREAPETRDEREPPERPETTERPSRPETTERPSRPETTVPAARSTPGAEDVDPRAARAEVATGARVAPKRPQARDRDPKVPERRPARSSSADADGSGRATPETERVTPGEAGRRRGRPTSQEGRRPDAGGEVDAARRRRSASHGSELGEELRDERERSHRREVSRRAAGPDPQAEAPPRSGGAAPGQGAAGEYKGARPVAAGAPPRRRTLRRRIRERGERR